MLPHAKATKNRKHKNSTQNTKTISLWVRKEEKDEETTSGSAAEPRSAPPCATPVPEGTGVGGGAYFPQVAAGRTQGAHGAHLEHPTVHTRGTPGTRGTPHTEHTTATPSPQRPPPALRQRAAPAPLYPPHTPCPAPPRRAPPHRTQRPRARALPRSTRPPGARGGEKARGAAARMRPGPRVRSWARSRAGGRGSGPVSGGARGGRERGALRGGRCSPQERARLAALFVCFNKREAAAAGSVLQQRPGEVLLRR